MESEYVGIDLHRRRSVIVRMSRDGEQLSTVKIDNDPIALAAAIALAGPQGFPCGRASLGLDRPPLPADSGVFRRAHDISPNRSLEPDQPQRGVPPLRTAQC